jgi:c-di-GMP-binding flagellar brake protein YcgR
MNQPERRRHKRIQKAYSVSIRPEGETHAEWDMILLKDISAGGIHFRYDSEWKIGAHLDMKIQFELNQAPIRCTGTVVRCLAFGNPVSYDIGVQYLSIGQQEAALIDQTAQKFAGPHP